MHSLKPIKPGRRTNTQSLGRRKSQSHLVVQTVQGRQEWWRRPKTLSSG
jgi:hypothetical protein